MQHSAQGLENGDLVEEVLSAPKYSDARLSHATFLRTPRWGSAAVGNLKIQTEKATGSKVVIVYVEALFDKCSNLRKSEMLRRIPATKQWFTCNPPALFYAHLTTTISLTNKATTITIPLFHISTRSPNICSSIGHASVSALLTSKQSV